jgi:hypothetical protein
MFCADRMTILAVRFTNPLSGSQIFVNSFVYLINKYYTFFEKAFLYPLSFFSLK